VLAAQRRLAESAGGTYHQLADQDIPAALLAFAHAHNATQLLPGATPVARAACLPVRCNGTRARMRRGRARRRLHGADQAPAGFLNGKDHRQGEGK
jgi:hypothetical protein